MNKKNCLVIGSGSIGERHAKNLVSFFNRKVFVLSRSPNQEFRDEFLNKSEYVSKISQNDLINFRDFEMLVLATPSSIRSKVLEPLKGIKIKVIYTEVPAATDFDSWYRLKELSSLIGARLYPGYNMRFHPGILKLQDLKKSHFLSLRGLFGEFLPDLHKWEDYKFRYEAVKKLGGGPLLTSQHEIDIAILLMGDVDNVSCLMRNTLLDIEAPDHVILNLFHKNGSISNLDLNFFYKQYVRRLELSTEEEIIKYEPFNDGLKIGKREKISFKDFDFNKTYIDSVNDALSNKFDFAPSLESIDHLMKVSDACLKSSENNGKIIKVYK